MACIVKSPLFAIFNPMNELKLFEQVKDEPVALIVLAGVVLIKIIEYAIKYAPRFFYWLFGKGTKMPFWKWQNFVIERIDEIEAKIGTIFSTLSVHEFLLDKTSEGTLENILNDEYRSLFQRLKAFRRLLAMKKNGRIWEKGLQLIILGRKTIKDDKGRELKIDIWLDVLGTELGTPIVDNEYYEARLKEIRRQIYSDFSER
jgi:hypothetical protein